MASVSRPRAANQRKPARPPHGLARLLLVINGTSYSIRRISCDPGAALKAFRLKKVDGTTYHVASTEFGLICDCGDFTFRRDGIDPDGCKHIKAMIAVGLIVSGRGKPASDGRVKTSHFEETRDRHLGDRLVKVYPRNRLFSPVEF